MSTITESQLLATMRESQLGQEMMAEIEARDLAERRTAKQRIEELKGELSDGLPPLMKKEAAATAKVEQARKALESAFEAQRQAYAARSTFAAKRQHQIGRLERQLRDDAPEVIDDAIREIDRSADRVRCDGLDYASMAELERSLASHGEARQAAESLRYEAVDDFAEALAKIRASIELPGVKS